VFIGHELNTAFPCVMCNLPAEIEYTILTDVVRDVAGRYQDIKVNVLFCFIRSVMIINFIYTEIVYMNIV
jgi:hypothetical protein